MVLRSCLTAVAANILCACVHTVSVATTPSDASVHTVNASGGVGNLIGQTPLVLPPPQKDEDFYHLKLTKPGHVPQVLVAPFVSSNKDAVELKISLKRQNVEWFKAAVRGVFAEQTDAVIREFLAFHESLIQENETESQRFIESLGKNYGNISTYHSLVGAYFWKKNRLEEAKKSYQKLLELVPKDPEAMRMLNVISTMMGS